MADPAIETERLSLVSMTEAFFKASLADDAAAATQLIGLQVPPEWFAERWLMNLRLHDIRGNPDWQPWMLRAIGLRATGEMIGHIGFHTPPGPEYLRETAPGGVEIGYSIFPAFRRHGYAREAVAGLMNWATTMHGVSRFVLSINPRNEPSLRIAQHFGFAKVATHNDEVDGPEDVFVLDV